MMTLDVDSHEFAQGSVLLIPSTTEHFATTLQRALASILGGLPRVVPLPSSDEVDELSQSSIAFAELTQPADRVERMARQLLARGTRVVVLTQGSTASITLPMEHVVSYCLPFDRPTQLERELRRHFGADRRT